MAHPEDHVHCLLDLSGDSLFLFLDTFNDQTELIEKLFDLVVIAEKTKGFEGDEVSTDQSRPG